MSAVGIIKRFLVSLVTLLAAMTLTFVLLRMTPGNAYDKWAQDLAIQNGITLEEAKEMVIGMSNYDPDEPIIKQYTRYMGGLLKGNLGHSMYNENLTVSMILGKALPWTIFMLSISLSISFLIGINLGVVMAWKRDSILNPIISIYSIVSGAIPNFLLAIFLMLIFSFKLQWTPLRGAYDAQISTPGFNLPFILSALHHAALPILTYVLTSVGVWALNMKGSAVSILGEDYITAAFVRGVPEKNIMKNYVKKNALLPLITALAISFGLMLGGSALIENQFNYPGLGFYMGQASVKRDYTIMQGLLFITSFAVIVANFVAGLLYAKLDPRVKLED